MSVMNKAMNLAYAELCNDVEDINKELVAYQNVEPNQIKEWASEVFMESALSKLHVKKSDNE